MWNFILLLCLSIASLSHGFPVDEECWGKCDGQALRDEFEKVEKSPPTGAELARICPPMLENVECRFEEVQTCTGHSVLIHAASDNETIAAHARSLIKEGELMVDLCNEDSQLHKDYLENVECFQDVVKDAFSYCYKDSITIANAFSRAAFPKTEDEPEIECIQEAYRSACFVIHIEKSCGASAKRVVMEFYNKEPAMMRNPCSPEQREILHGDFMEFLDIEDEQKPVYTSVFSLFKK